MSLGIPYYYIWQASEPAECSTAKEKAVEYTIWQNWSDLSGYIFG